MAVSVISGRLWVARIEFDSIEVTRVVCVSPVVCDRLGPVVDSRLSTSETTRRPENDPLRLYGDQASVETNVTLSLKTARFIGCQI